MTAHDALAAITRVLDSATAAEDPRLALFEIRCLIEDRQAQPFTPTLPTQPGWYVHKWNPNDVASAWELKSVFHGERGTLAIHDVDGCEWGFDEADPTGKPYVGGQSKGPLDLEAL